MSLNFNSFPYYDDFNPDKNFYRVLFKPGYAVQARELNQLQSILQHQISSFANHIFKKNSIVIPGGIALNSKAPILFTDDIELAKFLGKTITNAPLINGVYPQTEGYFDDYITAVVLGYKDKDEEYPACLYIKYFNSYRGTGEIDPYRTDFKNTDQVYTVDNTPINLKVNIFGTALGKVASLDKGIFYTKELFVDVKSQNIIVEASNSKITNCNIGLNIVESIIDYTTDDSLLDNAQGYPNQYAPGADRYKVELILSKYDPNTVLSDEKFIKLMTIENNDITFLNNTTQYSELMKILAKRTYDANGNFIVNGLRVAVTRANDDNYLWAGVGKGNCYLGGYEYNQIVDRNIPILKPRDEVYTESIPFMSTFSDDMPYFYVAAGNYQEIGTGVLPLLSYMPSTNELVQFINAAPFATQTNVVGYGVFKEIQYHTGDVGGGVNTKNNAVLKMYFDDIVLNTGYSLADIGGYVKILLSIGGTNVGGTILHQLKVSSPPYPIAYHSDFTKYLSEYYVQSSTGNVNERGSIYYYENNTIYVIKNSKNYKIPDTATITTNAQYTVNLLSSFVSNYNSNFNPIIKLDNSTIKTIKKKNSAGVYENVVEYAVIVKYSGVIINGTISFTAETGNYFEDFSTADYSAFIGDPAGSVYYQLPLTSSIISFNDNFSSLVCTLDEVFNGDTITLFTTQLKEKVPPALKTLVEVSIVIPTPSNSWMALGHQNVDSIISIKDSGSKLVDPRDPEESANVDITSRYILDSGSTSNGIYTGLIKIKRNVTKPSGQLLVTYKYYSTSNSNYSSVDSYTDNTDFTDVSYIGKIKDVYDTDKQLIPIRNYLDFRTTYSNYFFKNYGRKTTGNAILLKDLNLSFFKQFYQDIVVDAERPKIIGPGVEYGAYITDVTIDEASGDTLVYIKPNFDTVGHGTYFVGLSSSNRLAATSGENRTVGGHTFGNAIDCIFPKALSRITYAYTKFKPKHIHLYVNRNGDSLDIKQDEVNSYQDVIKYRRNEFRLPLAYIYLAPYTVDINDITVQVFENPVYNMLDIHAIKERVDRNEYYTSLSMNKDMHQEISDAQNETQTVDNRGFWNEDFEDAFSQDFQSDDYKCTMYNKSHVAPGTITRTISLSPTNTETTGNYKITGSTVTLPYKTIRALGCDQASTFNNLNPYNVINWQGKITLNPSVDNWVDTVTLPVIIRPVIIKDTPYPAPPPPPEPSPQPVPIPVPPPIKPPPSLPPIVIQPPPVVIQPPVILPPKPKPVEEIVTEITNLRTSWGKDSRGGYHAITFDWKTNLGRTGRVNSDRHLSSIINSKGFNGTYAKSLINKKYEDKDVKAYLYAGTHFDQKAPNKW